MFTVPPSGLLPVLTRLWWGRPQFFMHAHAMHHHMNPVSATTLREFYFTERAPQEILQRVMRHMSPESPSDQTASLSRARSTHEIAITRCK